MSYEGRDNLDIMHFAVNYNNYIYSWINTDKYNNILDFGAGNGEYCNRTNSNKIVAVEPDRELGSGLQCKCYKELKDIPNKSFDLIYSLNVLEHIKDDKKSVQELSSYLNKGGILKILVPARMEIYSKMDEKVGHFRRYKKNELIALLSKSNLEIVECRYFDFIGYLLSFIYKYTNNSGEINHLSLIFYDKILFSISLIMDKLIFSKIIGKNLMITAKKR